MHWKKSCKKFCSHGVCIPVTLGKINQQRKNLVKQILQYTEISGKTKSRVRHIRKAVDGIYFKWVDQGKRHWEGDF